MGKMRPKTKNIFKYAWDIETITVNEKQIPYLICV